MTTFAQRELAGWGRFPVESCLVARPEKRRDLVFAALDTQVEDLIARGLGRSYGDAALNLDAGVLLTEKLNRFLNFDASTGVLTAEGGVSLADILEVFVPRGYFLPVTPGTKFVTLGGAIAFDVHGKNHHRDGCISEFIDEFELLIASGETLTCSRTANPEAFWATVGGMGLTGIITTAKLRLLPIETSFIRASYTRTPNLDETMALFERSDDSRYSVVWIDGLATGPHLGRSILIRGDHVWPNDIEGEPLRYGDEKKKSVPRDLPSFALNPLSVKAFNKVYYASHPDGERIESFESYFWPLDAVSNWNRIYGSRGFVQHQCVLPFETAREGLRVLLQTIAGSGHAAFLGVLKKYGPANQSPLSFPLPGYSLALDIPATPDIIHFARQLDKIVVEHGGRIYLAKDSTLTAATARKMYPRLEEFEAVKAQLDPKGRFQSSLSKRLGIGGAA